MMSKKLLGLAPGSMRYILACVMWKWIGLFANIALIWGVSLVLSAVVEGGAIPISQAAILCAVSCIAKIISSKLSETESFKASSDVKRLIRKQIYEKVLRLGLAYQETSSTAEIVQVAVEGVEQLESYFGRYLPQLFYSVLAPLTLFFVILPFCWPAAVVLLLCVPLIPITIMLVQKIARKVLGEYWNQYTELGDTFLENLQGLTTLKIYQADAARHKKMNDEAEAFRQVTMRVLRMQLNSIVIMDVIALGGAVAGVGVALYAVMGGTLSLFGFLLIALLSADFFVPMRQLGSYFHVAMNGVAASEKIFKLIELPEPKGKTATVDPDASYTLSDVRFSYDGEREVLHGVSLEIPTHGMTAIVGESGSGKSTIGQLLTGAYDTYQGSIKLGTHEVRDIAPESLAKAVTCVRVGSYLFSGTVRDNLAMAKPDATDEEMWAVLERAALADYLRGEDGLDTKLERQGENLSGGQRQRLALARALLHDSPIYLFDEATSNIDIESEAHIMDAVAELAKTKSVIIISHRLANVVPADHIYVIKAGSIVGAGKHTELLGDCPTYRTLWDQQQELESYREHPVVEATVAQEDTAESAAAEIASSSGVNDAVSQVKAAGATSEHTAAHKPGNFALMWRMLGLAKPMAGIIVLAIVLGVLGFCCATAVSVLSARAGLVALGGPFPLTVAGCIVVLAILAVARGVLHYFEQLCNHFIAFKLLASVRDRVFGALRRLCPAKLAGADRGNLISTITSDVELLEVFYAHTISPICIAFITSIIMVVFVGTIHPLFGLVSALAYVVVGLIVPIVISKTTGDAGAQTRAQSGHLSSFVLDSLRGITEISQYNAGARQGKQLDAESRKLIGAQRVISNKAANGTAVVQVLILAFSLLQLALGVQLYLAGTVTPAGVLVSTVTLFSSFGPVVALANLGTTLQGTLASGARVLEILDEKPLVEENETGADIVFDGASVDHVGFSYGDERVLNNVNMTIPEGKIVGISGKSGSGKSTLCRLLMRFWDVDEGSISLAGVDVRKIRTASLRAAEALVEQDTYLFHDSIRDNLLIAKPDATDDELWAACHAASVDNFIKTLPHGLDTLVGELGDTLSGGERQRLGLARAFLHDAPFLLLDEPTSNLDSLNEGAILKSLSDERGKRTIVLISHRPSTMGIADEVFQMNRGRVS